MDQQTDQKTDVEVPVQEVSKSTTNNTIEDVKNIEADSGQ
jgi:hypothetical protein